VEAACWAASVATLVLALAPSAPVRGDGMPGAPQLKAEHGADGRSRLRFSTGGELAGVTDPDIPARSLPRLKVLGTVGDSTALVMESYRSRANAGGGQCGAGEERWLRVISLRPAPKEAYRVKLDSCWQNVELDHEFGERGLEWNAEQAILRIAWLSGPANGAPERRELRIAADGNVIANATLR
jgi:hypothetical protein